MAQWLYPGLDIVLQRAEAEGYFHNVSTGAAMVFVLWRMEEARAVPRYVTFGVKGYASIRHEDLAKPLRELAHKVHGAIMDKMVNWEGA